MSPCGMAKHWGLAALAVVVAGSGCTTSRTSGSLPVLHGEAIPDTAPKLSDPAVVGVVRDSSGSVVSGATVYASVELSKGERGYRGAKAFFSLGVLCADVEGCSTPTTTTLGAKDGTFAVAVPHGGDARDGLRVTVVAEHGETRVATSVLLPPAARAGVNAGDVPVAAGAPRTHLAGGKQHYDPPSVPSAHLGAATILLSRVRSTGADGQPVTDSPSTDVSGGFDPRVIEDGRVLLESSQSGMVRGRPAIASSSLVMTGTVVPRSRGASCTLTDSRGRPMVQQPCGLTDGILDRPWTPKDDPACIDGPCPGTAQHDHRDTYVTLPAPFAARLLVIRGCGFTCHVFVTDSNGTHALPEPDSSSPDGLYRAVLSGAGLRSVHIVTSTGGFLSALREVSVFT